MSTLTQLCRTVAFRNQLTTISKCNAVIDAFEADCPHDQLPPEYDWVVARRNRLLSSGFTS